MKILKPALFILPLLLFVLLAAAVSPDQGVVLSRKTIRSKFYDTLQFKKSVANLPERPPETFNIKGGIVPHHLLAGRMIADFFRVLSSASSPPEVVVVIGPDHKAVGKNEVTIADANWETSYGLLETEKGLVNQLIANKLATPDNNLFEKEHSISGLIPYIKYFLPEAKIVPVLIKGNCPYLKSAKLGHALHQIAKNNNGVIIASIDFSHYLPVEEADKMDEETFKAIKARDLQKLRAMRNDNLDSPPGIVSFLTSMNDAGAGDIKVLGHENSARILGKRVASTTSYFTMVFY